MASRIIEVRVKPNARSSELVDNGDGSWTARIHAPPVDGKANEALIALVAKRFGVAKSAVSIKSGAASRSKRVVVEGLPDSLTGSSSGNAPGRGWRSG